jgi:hypothetical protein
MKKALLLSTLSIAAAFIPNTALATPLCTDQSGTGVGGSTLNFYEALGTGGCLMNGLIFANFTYSYNVTNATNPNRGRDVADTAVNVTVNGPNTEFSFGGNWSTTGNQTSSLSLTYTVSKAPVGGNNVSIITSAFTSSVTSPGSLTDSATCMGGTCGASTGFTNLSVAIPLTAGVLTISDTASENSNSAAGPNGLVHLSIVDNSFAPAAPPGNTPEPASTILAGVGLLAFGGMLKRRSASR